MKKNIASQKIGAQMITAADGTAFTGTVTVYVTGDAGTQAIGSVGSGVCTHEGNGYHTYAPSQAETNYDLVAFTFIGTGAIPTTIQLFSRPTTGLLAPTVDGRTLDVSSTGEAGIDWANVGSPTTTLALTGTTISTSQVVASVTTKTGYSLLATTGLGNQTADITGNLSGSVGSIATGGITTASFAAGAINAAAIATDAIGAAELAADAATEIGTAVWAAATRTLTAGTNIQLPSNGLANITAWTVNVTGSLSGSVGSVSGAVGSVTGNVGGNVVGSVGSVTGHTPQTGDSFARIGATGSGLTSLASATNLATVAGYLDTEIGAIKAVTDALPNSGALTDISTAITTIDGIVDAMLVNQDVINEGVQKASLLIPHSTDL